MKELETRGLLRKSNVRYALRFSHRSLHIYRYVYITMFGRYQYDQPTEKPDDKWRYQGACRHERVRKRKRYSEMYPTTWNSVDHSHQSISPELWRRLRYAVYTSFYFPSCFFSFSRLFSSSNALSRYSINVKKCRTKNVIKENKKRKFRKNLPTIRKLWN